MTIHQWLAEYSAWFWPQFANHIWQATLFLLIAWIATAALKRGPAFARCAIWMSVSVKFALPSILLVALAGQLGIDFSPLIPRATVERVEGISTMVQPAPIPLAKPLVASVAASSESSSTNMAVSESHNEGFCLLTLVWLVGCVLVLAFWWKQRLRVSSIIKEGAMVKDGREARALARARSRVGIKREVQLLTTPRTIEPGVWGVCRPVVILSDKVGDCLTEDELESLMLHEVIHVTRWDNLISNLHMLLCCLFWFHPAVWLLDRELIKEREHSCDEKVIKLSGSGEVYASGILKVCRFCIAGKTVGFSSATGSNLKRRLIRIMTHDVKKRLGLSHVAAVGIIAAAFFVSVVSVSEGVNANSAAQSTSVSAGDQRLQITAEEIEKLPSVNISIEDSGAPVAISDAKIKVVFRKPFQVEGAASTMKSSDKAGVTQDMVVAPRITLTNNTSRVVTDMVVNIKNAESKFEYDIGRVGLKLKPGQSIVDDLGGMISLPGNPSRSSVKIVGIRFEDGSEWGNFVAPPPISRPIPKDKPSDINSLQRTIQPVGPEGQPAPAAIGLPTGPAVAMPKGRTMSQSPSQDLGADGGAVALPRGWSAVAHPSGEQQPGGRNVASTPPISVKPDDVQPDNQSAPGVKERVATLRYGGGVLHSRAIKQVSPAYPSSAKDAGTKGTVIVEVIVDENGNVESARVVSGRSFAVDSTDNPQLQSAALEAARQWKFSPATDKLGHPVKMIGELFFRF